MIKHIVIFKVKDEDKKANLLKAKEIIGALKYKIPQIVHIEVGIDFAIDTNPSDFVIYSEFNSKEDLEIYAKHSEHIEVVEFIKTIAIERRVVDYEV